MPYMPKTVVNYREATGNEKCSNCIMFKKPDRCSLVIGEIKPGDVCDEWEAKNA